MILSFSVENFKSFQNKETIDFECFSAFKENQKSTEDVLNSKYNKTIAMFGPNATGKTSFIDAIKMMWNIVNGSANVNPDAPLPFSPFFSKECQSKATDFQITFTYKGIKYRYGFSYSKKEIVSEFLFVSPRGREIQIFERKPDHSFDYGSESAGKELMQFQKFLITNRLFVSTLSLWNQPYALNVVSFFKESFKFEMANQSFLFSGPVTTDPFYDPLITEPEYKQFLISLLNCADINICDLEVKKTKIEFTIDPKNQNSPINQYNYSVLFCHDTSDGKKWLPAWSESSGTNTLIYISRLFYLSFKKEISIFIDEFDNSLHPDIQRFLIQTFINNSHSGSQLVFTTHNTSLMANDLFRRDQIYFFDKNYDGVSSIYKLSDFKVRKNSAFEKDYLMGRYGAVPMIVDYFKDKPHE